MQKFIFTLIIMVGLAACQEAPIEFSKRTEKAHQKEAFLTQTAISFDLLLKFGGSTRLDGKITLLTNSTKGKIEEKNGDILFYDNQHIYYDSAKIALDNARFKAYTWSYFFLFPTKLNDPGTVWEPYADNSTNSDLHETERLTFTAGTGDAPEDWYIVYGNKKTGLIDYAAYIVTANKTKEEAEADPHAIEYLNYKEVDGIPIATEWKFYEWREGKGLTNQLGEASLTNIQFIEADSTDFIPPHTLIEG